MPGCARPGELADQTTATISEHDDAALMNMTGNGSDPLGMLTLLQQANALYPEHALVNVLLTDGVNTIGVDPTAVPDADAARALADQQPVPELSGRGRVDRRDREAGYR